LGSVELVELLSGVGEPALVLRDDRRCASIPQDEGYTYNGWKALMLRDREAIVSKHEGGLTNAS
jgi:hypothetical protein